MSKEIYIANGEQRLTLTAGQVIAIRPVAKGESYSYCLTDAGQMVRLKDKMLQGMGVERFIKEKGYMPAPALHQAAAKLRDLIAIEEATDMVSRASRAEAERMQSELTLQEVLYVPFDAERPSVKCIISDTPFTKTLIDGSGFIPGLIEAKTTDGEGRSRQFDMSLSAGWVLVEGAARANAPRATEYGGLVEHAAYCIASAGLASVQLPGNLLVPENQTVDEAFPRGRLVLVVAGCNDEIVIGIDGADELVVQYCRDGAVIIQRHGLCENGGRLTLGAAVGSIAAVMLLARHADEKSRPTRAKNKAA